MKKRLSKKKSSVKSKVSKPTAILELEKMFGIELYEEKSFFLDEEIGKMRGNFYAVNENEEIAALSISNHGSKLIENSDFTLISNLERLQYLSLFQIELPDISSILPKPFLKRLYVGGNNIKKIHALSNCPLIEELAIWDNPIEDINTISTLKNLNRLFCQNTGINNLDFLSPLENLIVLYASGNSITSIDILSEKKNLIELDLRSNKIQSIPISIAQKMDWNISTSFGYHHLDYSLGCHVGDNPLMFPPTSVIDLGTETIEKYYESTEMFGHAPLSEGRIIVVGDGSAGKSSLIERILHGTFRLGKSQTNGIFIDHWHLPHNNDRSLTFHIWDFGGQEIQHAVHKFFFTAGCLYILVLDNRKEEEPEYWLQQIESLGGNAPVMVVFNKQDDNVTEIADRKFLKEKYPNIIGFYNTSCKTNYGVEDFKAELKKNVVELRTVDESFPKNWFKIKTAIEDCTSGEQHYLDYSIFNEICTKNNVPDEKTQKLLLQYFTTIGAVTWFGDTYLNFLHVLSPKWITQGVYKIITAKKTNTLSGNININDFKELLSPISSSDYTYEETHYGYILSMMKKFDLCYTPDDKSILIPSAFGKMPKVEYSDFRGEGIRTYILQFKDYMPLALIHRFTAKKLPDAFDGNYWYSGIVIRDSKSDALAMVQADKEAKRIYIRVKEGDQVGLWGHIRREFHEITASYAMITYNELISLDERSEAFVDYDDLVSHIVAGKSIYFHPKLKQDFNVGYLIGMFENKSQTLEKFKDLEHDRSEMVVHSSNKPTFVINVLNNNSPTISTNINSEVNIDIDLTFVNNCSSSVKGDATYLLEGLESSNKELIDALNKIIQFADDAKEARNSSEVIEKGWKRKLKTALQTIVKTGENLKKIEDGTETLSSMLKSIKELAAQFNLDTISELISKYV